MILLGIAPYYVPSTRLYHYPLEYRPSISCTAPFFKEVSQKELDQQTRSQEKNVNTTFPLRFMRQPFRVSEIACRILRALWLVRHEIIRWLECAD